MMWGQHIWLDPNAVEELKQCGGKVALCCAADPTDISIYGQSCRQTILTQKVDDGIESGFRMKIFMGLSAKQTRRASINKITPFDPHDVACSVGRMRQVLPLTLL